MKWYHIAIPAAFFAGALCWKSRVADPEIAAWKQRADSAVTASVTMDSTIAAMRRAADSLTARADTVYVRSDIPLPDPPRQPDLDSIQNVVYARGYRDGQQSREPEVAGVREAFRLQQQASVLLRAEADSLRADRDSLRALIVAHPEPSRRVSGTTAFLAGAATALVVRALLN